MKKAPALITLAIILSTVALTFYLSLRKEKQSLDAWQLVSSNSIGVLETTNPQTLQKLKTDTSKLLSLIVSAAGKRAFNDPYLFSFQSVGRELGWVAILPKQFPNLLDTLNKSKVQVKHRSYEGKTLYDIYSGNSQWVTLTEIDGYWAASRYPILVESVVRQNQTRDDNFKRKNSRLFALPAVKQDDGNFFIGNTSILKNTANIPLPLTHSLMLDLEWQDQMMMANGFATDTTNRPTLLSLFDNQQPVSLDLRKTLPDDLQSAVHFGFSDPRGWFKKSAEARKLLEKNDASFIESVGFDPQAFAAAVDNEMVFCRLDDGGEVLLIELKEITKSQAQLEKIRANLSKADRYARDNYANRTIHTLKKENILESITWPFRLMAPETSYAFDGNILMISPAAKYIESFINITDAERTTGKSVSWQRFLETTLEESNVSFLINHPPADFSLSSIGLPSLAPVDKWSFQFYSLEGNHYASGSVQFSGQTNRVKPTERKVTLSGRSLMRPSLVRNYLERQNEILVQDSANSLQLIDGKGKPRWSKAIGDRITTSIGEIDYLKNGKLQYVFCTQSKLHVVDRLGQDVKGFPRTLDVKNPRWLSIVDYDNTRNYRFMIADDHGNIYITDKDGKALDGWSPKSLGRPFVDAPDFFRIQRKDYFLAVTVDGDIHLFNRRGEPVPGFPLKTRIIPSGQVSCDGKTIAIVSQDGRLQKYDNLGKVVFEEPLLKNVKDAGFRMAVSHDKGTFVVIRTERGNLAVFDASGKQRFEVTNPLSDKLDVQFVQGTREKEFVVVRDLDQSLLFVVDMKGQPLTKQPVAATQAPAIDYDREASTIRMFIVNEDRIEIIKLPY